MKHLSFQKNTLVAALALANLLPGAAADEIDQEFQSIEVVTVLGEKTERSLKDTTSSVSVITQEQIESGQYLAISNMLSEVPNVVSLSGAVADIRGVSGNGSATGFNSFTGGAKARVSTLIDGIAQPFVADMTGDSGLWDIEQVEVFRGPQSTINGENSIGGTVFIKTKDASFDWGGAARLGVRNQDQFTDAAFALTGPILEDQLAFRISGQRVDGETFNKGLVYDTNPKSFDQNELITDQLRAKLLWQPAGISGLKIHFNYSHYKEKGDSGRNYFLGDDPWAFKPLFQRYITTKSNSYSTVIDYQLNDSTSFDLLIAFLDYQWGFDSYESEAAAQSQVLMEDDSFTVDAKINFGLNSKALSGFVGLAYRERDQKFNSIGGYSYGGDDDSTAKSVYGELSYTLSEQLKLILGGRVQKEQQSRNFVMAFRGQTIDENLDIDKTISLPKLVLQYFITDNTTLGFSARKGYNAGGGSLSLLDGEYYYYDQETVNTFEISSRSSLHHGNINVSVNLFYNDFDGYQGSNTERKITNIKESTTSGLEFALTAMLTEDLQLTTGFGYLSTEITDVDPSFGDIKGNELNSAPDLTANLGFKYWLNDELAFGISANRVGEYFGDINNTKELKAGGYTITRLNLDYQSEQWRVSAFVNNAFDKQALTLISPPSGYYPTGYAAIVDPRNVGVNVTYSF